MSVKLIKLFTDEGDVIIDPCAGSGSSLIAARNLRRKSYGFDIEKEFYKKAYAWINGMETKEEEEERKANGIMNIFDYLD